MTGGIPGSYNLREISELLGVTADKILAHIHSGKVHPMMIIGSDFYFSTANLTQLGELLKGHPRVPATPSAPNPAEEFFTVRELASLWSMSEDSIHRLFENESGVVTLADPSPRGLRKLTTLRIPLSVAERVQKKRTVPPR